MRTAVVRLKASSRRPLQVLAWCRAALLRVVVFEVK